MKSREPERSKWDQFTLILFGALGLTGDLNHAEEVAIGIFQQDIEPIFILSELSASN